MELSTRQSMLVVRKRPARDEWEAHRRTIYQLFINESLSYQELATQMRERYGFDKKPRDYEYRLSKSKWNFRQKLTEDAWKWVASETQSRASNGKNSEVLLCGAIIPEDTVRNRITFYRRPTFLGEAHAHSDPPRDIPVRIRTPPLSAFKIKWPESLPWLRFSKHFSAWSSLILDRKIALATAPPGPMVWQVSGPKEDAQGTALNSLQISPNSINSFLDSFCPELHTGDHFITTQILKTGSRDAVTTELAKMLLYCMSNNLVNKFYDIADIDRRGKSAQLLWQTLHGLSILTRSHLEHMSRAVMPTTRAALDVLIPAALSNDDTEVLSWLFRGGALNLQYRIAIDYRREGEHIIREADAYHGYTLQSCSPGASYRLARSKFMKNRGSKKQSLLQAAASRGSLQSCAFLINEGMDVNDFVGTNEPSPLEYAASLESTSIGWELFCQLRSSGAAIQAGKSGAQDIFLLAVASSNHAVAREALEMGAVVSTVAFRYAAKYADEKTIHLLSSSVVSCPEANAKRGALLPRAILSVAILANTFDVEKLEALLEAGADPNEEDDDGHIPIEVAISAKGIDPANDGQSLAACRMLLQYGAKPDRARRYWGKTPSALQRAANCGAFEIVQLLLDHGADPNCRNTGPPGFLELLECRRKPLEQPSPLSTALASHEFGISKLLLQYGAQLVGGELECALAINDGGFFLQLLNHGASYEDHVFCTALKWRSSSVLKIILQRFQVDLSQTDVPTRVNMLKAALIADNDTLINQLLELRLPYDPGVLYEAAIFSLRVKEYSTIERIIASRHYGPRETFEVAALAFAVINQSERLLFLLGDTRFEVSSWTANFCRWNTQFDLYPQYSCAKDGLNHINLGETYGEHVDRSSTDLQVHILEVAAYFDTSKNGSTAAVETLLKFGVSVRGIPITKMIEWATPRDIALILDADKLLGNYFLTSGDFGNGLLAIAILAYPRREDVVDVLLEAGASGEVKSWHHESLLLHPGPTASVIKYFSPRTTLQAATESNLPQIMRKLLLKGANVNAKCYGIYGATCLQIAAINGHIGLVRYLLGMGAVVNAPRARWQGRTALEGAAENGRLDVVEMLLDYSKQSFEELLPRSQVIRAAKFAIGNGYYAIAELLKGSMIWTNGDQCACDGIDITNPEVVDEMTQPLSYEEELILNIVRQRHVDHLAGADESWDEEIDDEGTDDDEIDDEETDEEIDEEEMDDADIYDKAMDNEEKDDEEMDEEENEAERMSNHNTDEIMSLGDEVQASITEDLQVMDIGFESSDAHMEGIFVHDWAMANSDSPGAFDQHEKSISTEFRLGHVSLSQLESGEMGNRGNNVGMDLQRHFAHQACYGESCPSAEVFVGVSMDDMQRFMDEEQFHRPE